MIENLFAFFFGFVTATILYGVIEIYLGTQELKD